MTFCIAFMVLVLDGLTKFIAVRSMLPGQSIRILGGIFHFTLIFNKGAAFGLFTDQRIVFIPLSIIVITAIILHEIRKKGKRRYVSFALGLILGGAIGNLIDRVRFGYVIDFLDFRIWPVFNIADSCVTVGAILLIYSVMAGHRASSPIQNRDP